MKLARRLVLSVVRPSALAEEIRVEPRGSDGMWAMVATAVVWSVLCVVLYAGGHGPSITLVPIPRESYYLAQAIFVVPLLVALWWGMGLVGHAIARGDKRHTLAALGYAYAAPIMIGFLAVDFAIYFAAGHDAMGRWLRFYAPIAPLWSLGLGTYLMGRLHDVSRARAFGATLAALVAQALVGGVLLR